MTPEQQRIAIAEACGWRGVHVPSDFAKTTTPATIGRPSGFSSLHATLGVIPDYLSDLNAMHEAEQVLTESLWHTYVMNLAGLGLGCGNAIRATAAQRAEAFLRTVGKWTSTK